MNIVHLVEDLGLGGMERVVQSLAKMAQGEFPTRVLCTRAQGPVAEDLRDAGVRVELTAGSVLPLKRKLKPLRPFILHTHGASRTLGRLAGRLAGAVGVVHHMHGTERYGLKQKLFERALPADVYLACSNAVRENFRRQVGPLAVEVLYNPIDAGRFLFSAALRGACRTQLGIADDAPVILCVGRFVADKGQRFLIEALPAILSRHPDAVILFIGEGPTRGESERLAAAFGRSVQFLGLEMDVLPFLCACDVYVQPSVNREALGVAALEAMSCGRAVIATRIEGLIESVGEAGLLVAPADGAALARAVLELLGSSELRKERANLGRQRVLLLFSLDQAKRKLMEIYGRLAAAA